MKKSLLFVAGSVAFIFLAAITLSFGGFKGPKVATNLPLPRAKISPTPSPSPWLTYVNDHYNYSLNYPRTWEKTEWEFHEATQLNISRKQQEGMIWQQTKFEGQEKSFQVLLWVNRQKAAVPQWLEWYRHQDLDLRKIPASSNYQILDQEAYLMFSEKTPWGYPAVRIFFSRGEYIFELIAQSPSENLDKVYQEIITSFTLF